MYRNYKSLRERNYRSSSTFAKYQEYVGKLLSHNSYSGFKVDPITGKEQLIYTKLLYMVVAVHPHKWYRNRFGFKLCAVGSHDDLEFGAADLVKRLNIKGGDWEIYNHES